MSAANDLRARSWRCVCLLAGLFAIGTCYADGPMPPPEPATFCSPSKMYCVDFISRQGGIAYQIGNGGKRRELWHVPGWQRVAFVSDDGRHLAACYSGQNLIPQDYSPDMVMISIFDQGRLTHEIRLNSMITDFGALHKTVSHYYWGSCKGLAPDGTLQVETVEHKALSIDLVTGQVREK